MPVSRKTGKIILLHLAALNSEKSVKRETGMIAAIQWTSQGQETLDEIHGEPEYQSLSTSTEMEHKHRDGAQESSQLYP